ncbi:MAG: hypothetical protein ABI240_18270 [Sphingomonas sp.]
MTTRTAWRWCAAVGIAAFTISWLFGRIPGLVACGPAGGLGPIMAFELARSTGDIAAMFGSEPCASTLVGAQKTGLLLDGLGFIPSYTGFLILGAIAAGARGRIRALLITLFVVAAISDEIEGFLLNAILDHLPGTPTLLDALAWEVHVKFGLLALGTFGIGGLFARGRWFQRAIAAAIVLGSMIAMFGLLATPGAWMMTGFTIAWVSLLLAALIAPFWPSLFSPAPASPPPSQAAPSA